MKTIFNTLKSLFSNSTKRISSDVQLQVVKADCADHFTSGEYCDSEKPFIPNYYTNN
jgi:hypothetical protein